MSNHEQAMPVVQDKTLISHKDGQDFRITVGTPAWYAWLRTANTFAFRSEQGLFTARKDLRQCPERTTNQKSVRRTIWKFERPVAPSLTEYLAWRKGKCPSWFCRKSASI